MASHNGSSSDIHFNKDVNQVEFLNYLNIHLSDEVKHQLMMDFREEEVKEAIVQMQPWKSPRLDGIHVGFYQKFWSFVGPKVTNAMLWYLQNGHIRPKWNWTNIVLIPKVPNPYSILDLRPISLCNVIYKIVAKILVNRLRSLLV